MKYLSLPRVRRMSIALGIALLALVPLLLYLTRQTAEAQCGTSISSCKNCHEVQGEAPVNTIGEWHTGHAFGDFCEFCHAGNVESKNKDEAHVGMVDTMVDVKASCQSCHPQDYDQKAQVYAAALGIHLGAGGGSGGGAVGGDSGDAAGGAPAVTDGGSETGADASGETASETTDAAAVESDMSAAPDGEIVDYNQLYAASQTPEAALSTGDMVLIVLIALLLLAFFIALWRLEHWGDRLLYWWQQNLAPQTRWRSKAQAAPQRCRCRVLANWPPQHQSRQRFLPRRLP